MVASCSIQEDDFKAPVQDDVIFYASFEQPSEGTRVYANEDLLLRWTADDRVSIFNKLTYNQQYKFTGNTGANAGGFKKVDSDEFVTGNTISHVVSVYPYQESTEISESEVLTLTLPAEQRYAENTFGLGANKNVGGYLRLRLYGEGVSVSSITLKGNNGEKLAGKATVTMPLDGVPAAVFSDDATDEITLICDTPVALDATAEESKDFWFVVPPVTFSAGFSVTVFGDGGIFVKSTEKTVTIERNKLSKMSSLEVVLSQPNNVIFYTSAEGEVITPNASDVFGANIVSNEYVDGRGVITFDGDVTSIGNFAFSECTGLTSITIPDSVTSIGRGVFDFCTGLTSITIPDSVTSIGDRAFYGCRGLTSITIPDSVTSIGNYAFRGCTGLTSVHIPDSVTSIGTGAFRDCTGLTSVHIPDRVTSIGEGVFASCVSILSFSGKYASQDGVFLIDSGSIIAVALGLIHGSFSIPDGVTSIGDYVFYGCTGLTSITIPDSVTSIGNRAFQNCTGLTSITIPDSVTSIGNWAFDHCTGLTAITIPDSVTSIGGAAFQNCTGLTSITIPDSVTSIGDAAFNYCTGLTSITVLSVTPPTGGYRMFSGTNDCPIYVPAESVNVYKTAEYWSDYADRIQAIPSSPIPVPEAIDLGLPSGLKWAAFNLGASKPEEYGDYYAWGETEPYYSSQNPLTWKEGKGEGYDWSSYKWCMGFDTTITKYCSSSSYGYNGFTDTKTVLGLEDDAAHANLGGKWRMPTKEEQDELLEKCSWEWTQVNGINGRKVTGPNGNSIFLPATGNWLYTGLDGAGSWGYYWSSSLNTDGPYDAFYLYFFSAGDVGWSEYNRYGGLSVRPVCE